MHHALTRDRRLQRLVGYVGFGLYGLSPTLWVAWHNQAHHGNTGRPIADPDGFGRLGFWRKSAVVRTLEKLSPGSGHKRSAAFLFIWFSLHSFLVLVFHGSATATTSDLAQDRVSESGAMLAFCSACWRSSARGAFVYVVPLLVANAHHVLHRDQPLPEPSPGERSARQQPVGDRPALAERLHLNSATTSSTTCSHAQRCRAPAVRDVLVRPTAIATLRRTRARVSCTPGEAP
jgi:fatty acid desaturase